MNAYFEMAVAPMDLAHIILLEIEEIFFIFDYVDSSAKEAYVPTQWLF